MCGIQGKVRRHAANDGVHPDWEQPENPKDENAVEAAEKGVFCSQACEFVSLIHRLKQVLTDCCGLCGHTAIEQVKRGLLGGKLVFLTPSEAYSQTSVFVLMHGTLRTEKVLPKTPDEYTDPTSLDGDGADTETVEFAAPCVFSWIMDPSTPAEPFNFVTGSEGAMLVAAFADRKTIAKRATKHESSEVSVPCTTILNHSTSFVCL